MDLFMIVMFIFFCFMTVISYIYLLISLKDKEKHLSFDDKTKTVFCDGKKVISVRDGSGNHRFIKYIFENTDRQISVTELETDVFFGQNVNIVKVLSNTHLPKEIINMFFSVSKNSLIFKNKAFLK
ncbi:hypothetical protein [Photobacterium toruni]|uniref:Uncharacterized protein n=2 Tax=Photobacterium toruni TaxID=1935446 RepID=A0A1T4L4V5_9GAMM|nr:hypothetical protein [Photobacterium toruni]SJZ49756.1 hypothetical protein CZ814_00301 [Photobacterium toruni]